MNPLEDYSSTLELSKIIELSIRKVCTFGIQKN